MPLTLAEEDEGDMLASKLEALSDGETVEVYLVVGTSSHTAYQKMTLEFTLAAGDALTDNDDELETDDVFRDDDIMLTEVDDILAMEYETLAGEETN